METSNDQSSMETDESLSLSITRYLLNEQKGCKNENI